MPLRHDALETCLCACRTLPEALKEQLIITIQKTFQYSRIQAEKLLTELMLCIMKRELVRYHEIS